MGVIGYHVTLAEGHMITSYKETLVPHLAATLIYLSQIYIYYISDDRSPLRSGVTTFNYFRASSSLAKFDSQSETANFRRVRIRIVNPDHPQNFMDCSLAQDTN